MRTPIGSIEDTHQFRSHLFMRGRETKVRILWVSLNYKFGTGQSFLVVGGTLGSDATSTVVGCIQSADFVERTAEPLAWLVPQWENGQTPHGNQPVGEL